MDKEIYDQIQQIEQSHWWYVARRRIIFDWVLAEARQYREPKILDVGCGTGFNLDYLHKNGYSCSVGLDFSLQALGYCRTRYLPQLVCGDGTCPPFEAESFDMVLALDLIEHLSDDIQALAAFARLLRPGGVVVLFAPAFSFLWGLQDEVSHHYRRYTGGELKQQVSQAGLEITKLTYCNTFLFPLILSGRLLLRVLSNRVRSTSENDLHPGWSNQLLQMIFAAERPLLRHFNFPIGVSLLCIAKKLS